MNDPFGIHQSLKNLGINPTNLGSSTGLTWLDSGESYFSSDSPVDGQVIAKVQEASEDTYEAIIAQASVAFEKWRIVPAPHRGEIVREIGNALREVKADLGKLVSYEMGKSYQEGLGEVQEMIDICDFAVGLSRQLYGLTMHSERPGHRMYEQWHPLGIVGIISAFNFPVAVWSWNAALAWVCGDVCLWKPSEKAPLSGIACQHIVAKIFAKHGFPEGVSNLIIGDYKIGELISHDSRVPLVSATGSTRMGKLVGKAVGERLGRSLLELGGNNAIIITENADLDMAIRGALFGAARPPRGGALDCGRPARGRDHHRGHERGGQERLVPRARGVPGRAGPVASQLHHRTGRPRGRARQPLCHARRPQAHQAARARGAAQGPGAGRDGSLVTGAGCTGDRCSQRHR